MLRKATFAGGCFWCMQDVFDFVEGVVSTEVGYAMSPEGEVEAINIIYDEEKVSYKTLLDVYWHNIDPEDAEGQFSDRGKRYRTYIFYRDEKQRMLAEESKESLKKSGKFQRVATEIVPFSSFRRAEDYHQKFYLKNPRRYREYKEASGRVQYLREVWGGVG